MFCAPTGADASCNDLTTAHYSKEPEFDPRAEAILRVHPIHKLSEDFKKKGIRLVFDLDGGLEFESRISGAGYPIQRRSLQKILKMAFPEAAFSSAVDAAPTGGIEPLPVNLGLIDSALQFDQFELGVLEPASRYQVEMSRMKLGNPEVFSYSRSEIRKKLGFPLSDRIVSVYSSMEGLYGLHAMLRLMPEKPQIVILSHSTLMSLDEIKTLFGNARSYDFASLKVVLSRPEILTDAALRSKDCPLIIYNDTRGRLPELYAASDLALVIGANNFFEPLIAKCPTLLYPGSLDWLDYSPRAYRQLAETAVATGGAVLYGGEHTREALTRAYEKLLMVNPSSIQHPAFVRPRNTGLSGFNALLDDLEEKIRSQVHTRLKALR
ncbi:MAG: hypothetical protein EBX52_10170 [Proteobacteria bacterium]|nr:hypothetical protein [Pseudomonadota bacterium]